MYSYSGIWINISTIFKNKLRQYGVFWTVTFKMKMLTQRKSFIAAAVAVVIVIVIVISLLAVFSSMVASHFA